MEDAAEDRMLKVVTFGIKGLSRAFDEFEAAWEIGRRRGQRRPPADQVCFTSLEAARNFLTPKRLALLRLIKAKQPKSLYALAKLAKRSFPSVLKDVELLKRHGLLTLTRERSSPRRSVHPGVPYDAINLWIGV